MREPLDLSQIDPFELDLRKHPSLEIDECMRQVYAEVEKEIGDSHVRMLDMTDERGSKLDEFVDKDQRETDPL